MTRKANHSNKQYTKPDHRPMLPEFRNPETAIEMAVREMRLRRDEIIPVKFNWR